MRGAVVAECTRPQVQPSKMDKHGEVEVPEMAMTGNSRKLCVNCKGAASRFLFQTVPIRACCAY
jgi:hypothetical protein